MSEISSHQPIEWEDIAITQHEISILLNVNNINTTSILITLDVGSLFSKHSHYPILSL